MEEFSTYLLNLNANLDERITSMSPVEGWNSGELGVTMTMKCNRCSVATPPVHISKDVITPYSLSTRGGRKKLISANAVQKCMCPKKNGVILITKMPGKDLRNGGGTTLMSIDVGEDMTPLEIKGIEFDWQIKCEGGKIQEPFKLFPVDRHANLFSTYGQVGEDGLRVYIAASFIKS